MTTQSQAKKRVKQLFRILIWPLYGLYKLMARLGEPDRVFTSFSQFLSLFPGKTGGYLRAAFYSRVCPETSDEIAVGFLTLLSHRDTTIKKGVYIGPQCNIGKCTIGENTLIGSGVHILSGNKQHSFEDPETPIQQQQGRFEKIRIDDDCWLGNNCCVLTSLPAHCIVATGSVVTSSSFIAGDIIIGNPGKRYRNRFKEAGTE